MSRRSSNLDPWVLELFGVPVGLRPSSGRPNRFSNDSGSPPRDTAPVDTGHPNAPRDTGEPAPGPRDPNAPTDDSDQDGTDVDDDNDSDIEVDRDKD